MIVITKEIEKKRKHVYQMNYLLKNIKIIFLNVINWKKKNYETGCLPRKKQNKTITTQTKTK